MKQFVYPPRKRVLALVLALVSSLSLMATDLYVDAGAAAGGNGTVADGVRFALLEGVFGRRVAGGETHLSVPPARVRVFRYGR